MREQGSLLGFLSDPRLASYALGDAPVWLWSADATRILWGNPAAAAAFNAPSSIALTGHSIDPKGSAALQIARLAGTLGHGAAPRLERLRGFGGRVGGAVLCSCSRISLADRTPGILVVATEPVGRLSLAAKAQRLLGDCDEPLALFAADGKLLSATDSARSQIGGAKNLAEIGAAALGATALAAGRAEGQHRTDKFLIERIGADPSIALLLAFTASAAQVATARPQPPAAPVQPTPKPVPPAATTPMQPLRFVWQIDDGGRFNLESDEFKALIGPQTAALIGQPWNVMAAALRLDPDGQVARAVASRETWSGITVAFPVDGSDARLAVELSGLPVFDRDRNFLGYRGFGVCREAARVAELARTARPTISEIPATEPPVFREERLAPQPPINVVPLRPPSTAEDGPVPTPVERRGFGDPGPRPPSRTVAPGRESKSPEPSVPPARQPIASPTGASASADGLSDQRSILDRLPIGVLVYRLEKLIYANRAFLEWTGYGQLYALEQAGGLDALFVEPSDGDSGETNGGQSLTIATNQGDQVPVAARLFTAPWDGESAMVLMLTGVGSGKAAGNDRPKVDEIALRAAQDEITEIRSLLDAAADGIAVLDNRTRVESINSGASKLFGYESEELAGLPFTTLFAPQSQGEVLQHLGSAATARPGTPAKGWNVIGRHRDGDPMVLFMKLSKIRGDGNKLCAVFRDMSYRKKMEGELHDAKRQAEAASSTKTDFLAKVSHEIRTPLNAIIGFSEVMMQERFGPIGNERYIQYLEDIHTSGGHLISLLNDLLDLSKIEAGKLELKFTAVDLNELTQQSVALMQPQASRERIIIRTSLTSLLPAVTADTRSVRQILLNLISNSIKFTGVGGQVIVSTARGDTGEVVLRVRHTGMGMSEQELAAVLEPFRQIASSGRWGSGGTGLGLPLTKALAEANRASFRIKSEVDAGTLVEVAFPGDRVAAE
jgi:PAS domain S-box-containing protein